MRRTMKVVWKEDDTGRDLLSRQEDGEYAVIVAVCDAGTLAELGKAIADGLRGAPEGNDLRGYVRDVDKQQGT